MTNGGTKTLSPTRMLKSKETAARLGVTPRTLKTYISRGYNRAERLPSPKGLGHLRFGEREIALFWARRMLVVAEMTMNKINVFIFHAFSSFYIVFMMISLCYC